jgi:hypothetical protein
MGLGGQVRRAHVLPALTRPDKDLQHCRRCQCVALLQISVYFLERSSRHTQAAQGMLGEPRGGYLGNWVNNGR